MIFAARSRCRRCQRCANPLPWPPRKPQGRLPGRAPVAVIDIGSNSVRLVIYEGLAAAPTLLFNEKVLCGLGRGLAKTGRMDDKAIERALAALRRFRALADQAGAQRLHVLATAAAREAENGSEFITAPKACSQRRSACSPARKRRLSRPRHDLGIPRPDGITGDLGGGSLELVDIAGAEIGRRPDPAARRPARSRSVGRLDRQGARPIARKQLKRADAQGRRRPHLLRRRRHLAEHRQAAHAATHYPLHVMHDYEIDADEAMNFLKHVARRTTARTTASRRSRRTGARCCPTARWCCRRSSAR